MQGLQSDYAYLIYGLMELQKADSDAAWLDWAVALQKIEDDRFWDAQNGGYFLDNNSDGTLLFRSKEYDDMAMPSGNSIAALNLLRLGDLTGREDALLMTARTETALLARKRHKEIVVAIRASHTSKSVMKVAALEELIDDFADDGPPKTEVGLVSGGIDPLEFVEVPGHKFVERRLGRPAGPVSPWRRTALPHEVLEGIRRAAR